MFPKFKKRPAYYSVHALRDGTIWLAVQTRKPSKNETAEIDEDGIYRWFLDEADIRTFSESGKCVRNLAIVTALNTKRILREQVEKKLDLVLEKLEAIERRLNNLENR